MMVEHFFLVSAIIILLLILITLVRVIGGPTVGDRILGGNVVGTKTTVLLLLIGVIYEDLGMFVDIAIAYALLNFIATLGFTKFFLRRRGTDDVLAEVFLRHEEADADATKGDQA